MKSKTPGDFFTLQETLGSFASGLMIMVYRPFDVDDYIAVAGGEGTVKEMSLVSTTLLAIDNKVLIIPNKKAWGDTIVNYTGRDIHSHNVMCTWIPSRHRPDRPIDESGR